MPGLALIISILAPFGRVYNIIRVTEFPSKPMDSQHCHIWIQKNALLDIKGIIGNGMNIHSFQK